MKLFRSPAHDGVVSWYGSCFLGFVLFAASSLGPTAALPAQDADYSMTLTDAVGLETVTVSFVLDSSSGIAIEGWQAAICHDTEVLDLPIDGVSIEGLLEPNPGLSFRLQAVTHQPGEGFTIGVFLNPITQSVLFPDVHELYEITYDVVDGVVAGTTTDVELCSLSIITSSFVYTGGQDLDTDLNSSAVLIEADCDRNGLVDSDEIASDADLDCNENGIPDACEDCDENGVADSCEIDEDPSLDCDDNGVLDLCEDFGEPTLLAGGNPSVSWPRIASGSGMDVTVYTYEDGAWLESMITGTSFVRQVAISGETLFVGYTEAGGIVRVFQYDAEEPGWMETQTITIEEPICFSFDLAVSGEWLVIGDRGPVPFLDGAVYLYARDATSGLWIEQPALEFSEPTDGLSIGRAVDIDQGTLVIGANDGPFVFEYDPEEEDWIEVTRLSVPYQGALAVADDVIVVGAGSNTRIVTVVRRVEGEWIEETELEHPETARFGYGVAVEIHGKQIAVDTGPDGDVFLFEDTGESWRLERAYEAEGISSSSSPLSLGPALFATRQNETFFVIRRDCNDNGILDSCEIEAGDVFDFNDNGIPDECESGPPPLTPFRRGDVNGDGTFSPLNDGVYLAEYGFVDGPVPPCLDAADVDGNGELFVLVDLIYLLSHGFQGTPAPPAPGPDECGTDPNDESNEIDCALPTGGCL